MLHAGSGPVVRSLPGSGKAGQVDPVPSPAADAAAGELEAPEGREGSLAALMLSRPSPGGQPGCGPERGSLERGGGINQQMPFRISSNTKLEL